MPILDLVVKFVPGNLGHRSGELHRAGSLFDLAAQTARQAIELGSGEVFYVAARDLRLDLAELLPERVDAVGDGV